jgi:hypothetical protein
MHATTTYKEVEVQVHSFLTSSLEVGSGTVRFRHQSLSPRCEEPQHPLNRRLGSPQD